MKHKKLSVKSKPVGSKLHLANKCDNFISLKMSQNQNRQKGEKKKYKFSKASQEEQEIFYSLPLYSPLFANGEKSKAKQKFKNFNLFFRCCSFIVWKTVY